MTAVKPDDSSQYRWSTKETHFRRDTYNISLKLAAMKANALENLLDLAEVADVKDGFGQVDVTKVTWTLLVTLTTCLTLVIPVESTKARVGETADSGFASFILDFWDLDLANRNRTLLRRRKGQCRDERGKKHGRGHGRSGIDPDSSALRNHGARRSGRV